MNVDAVQALPRIGVGVAVAGRYDIVGEIGAGGFARVFKAVERGPSYCRNVAVKILRTENYDNPDKRQAALARLHNEAAVLSDFAHPNIVSLLMAGTSHGEDFLALEYMPLSLFAWLRNHREQQRHVPFEQIKAIGTALGTALEVIHRRDVIHRDIKPANILVRDDAHEFVVKIADFGVAKVAGKNLTRGDEAFGTDGFVPADGLRGGAAPGDCRVDLFALGCVLFEATTGHRAFTDQASIIDTKPAVKANFWRTPIPHKLNDIIARLLQKNRDLRYPSATAFLREWAEFEVDGPMLQDEEHHGSVTFNDLRGALTIAPNNIQELLRAGEQEAASVGLLCTEDTANASSEDLKPASKPVATPFVEPSLDVNAEGVAAELNRNDAKWYTKMQKRDYLLVGVPLLAIIVGICALTNREKSRNRPVAVPAVIAPERPRAEITARDLVRDAQRLEGRAEVDQRLAKRHQESTQRSPPNPVTKPPSPIRQTAAAPTPQKTERTGSEALPVASVASWQKDLTPKPRRTQPEIPEEEVGIQGLGIVSTTTVSARLCDNVSSLQDPDTVVVAELTKPLRSSYKTVAPIGSKLVGKAEFKEKAGKHFVHITFSKLVDEKGSREWRIDAVARENDTEGLEGIVSRYDSREKANALKVAIDAVDDFAHDSQFGKVIKPFAQDKTSDARKQHQMKTIVQLPKTRAFEARFRTAA